MKAILVFPSHTGFQKNHAYVIGTRALHSLGLGYYKKAGEIPQRWTNRRLNWIDKYTHYHRHSEVREAFSNWFDVNKIQDDFVIKKLMSKKATRWAGRSLRNSVAPWLIRKTFPFYGCRCLLGTKLHTTDKSPFISSAIDRGQPVSHSLDGKG